MLIQHSTAQHQISIELGWEVPGCTDLRFTHTRHGQLHVRYCSQQEELNVESRAAYDYSCNPLS